MRARAPVWTLLVGPVAGLGLAGCDRAPLFCRDTLVAGSPSPDGSHVAEMVVRDCHLTTGYTVHLMLRSTKDLHRGPTAAVFGGARPPSLSWDGPRRLVVSPDAGSKVLYQTSQWDGVALSYRLSSRPPSGDKSAGR
jgi:hypothetical protein